MTKLGLPFEYQINPEFFDAYNLSETTDEKNSVIENILKKHGAKTVLDLTCGTGSQVFYLAERGYKVVGADFSPALIKVARTKAAKKNSTIRFLDGDMRTIHVGQFDAVITIFNAVGHLTKPSFLKAMRNINNNLLPGGIYVFDIMNLDVMTDETVANLAWHIEKIVDDTHIHGIQCSIINREKGRLTAFDHIVLQKNAERPKLRRHSFSLQIYGANELKNMLERQGFAVVDQLGLDGAPFVREKSLNILTVAKKKSE